MMQNTILKMFAAILTIPFFFYGCGSESVNDAGSGTSVITADYSSGKDDGRYAGLFRIWDSDVLFDGMTPYYENGVIEFREDDRDIPGSTADYYTGYLHEAECDEWKTTFYAGYDGNEKMSGAGGFQYIEDGRLYMITPFGSDAEAEMPKDVSGFMVLDPESSDAKDIAGNIYEHGHVYRGFARFNGEEMPCYTVLLYDISGKVYKITAAGTGSLLELKEDMAQITNTFMTKRTPEAEFGGNEGDDILQ